MSWLSDFYRKHPEYRALRVARRSACSIHFEIEPPSKTHGGVYQAFFQIKPIYSRVHRALWMPQSLMADAARLIVAGIRNPYAAAQFAALVPLATVLTLQPDGTTGKDALIDAGAVNSNYGGYNFLDVGMYQFSGIQRSLIQFNLASIPASAVVNSAMLSLWLGFAGNSFSASDNTARAYRMTRAWTEGTKSGGADADGATWVTYDSINNWQTAGCAGANDVEASDIGNITMLLAAAAGTQYDISLTVAKAQEWVSGVLTNNGLLLRADTETNTTLFVCCSSDHATAAYRPKLVVTYALAAGGAPIQQPFASAFRGPFGE